jgi:hypothetical protein
MDTSQVIAATFIPIMHEIVASAGAHGTIVPNGGIEVPYGDTQTFRILPDDGYRVAQVLVDGAEVSDLSSYSFETVETDHAIDVAFEPNRNVLTATASAHGIIEPSGTIVAGTGEDVAFKITPDGHYHIQSVVVDGASVGAVSAYAFEDITSDHVISANFGIDMYTVSATASSGGTIDPDGSWLVSYGHAVTFRVTPASGSHIADVEVDGTSVGPVKAYTLDNIDHDHIVRATFAPNG